MKVDTMNTARNQRLVDQPNWYRVAFAKPLAASIVLGLLVIGSFVGSRIWRVESNERALEKIHAKYAWTHESPARKLMRRSNTETLPKKVRTQLVAWLGKPLVSDIAQIRIETGNPNDEQLSFLPRLSRLDSLELHSHRATDATLEAISRLPNLRTLSLVGNRFSVMGLLKLRAVHSLEELRYDSTQFSAIEIATLKAELPGVRVEPIANASEPARGIFEVDGLSA